MANIFSATTSALFAAVAFSTVTLGIAISPALVADLAPTATVRIAAVQPGGVSPVLASSEHTSSARSQG